MKTTLSFPECHFPFIIYQKCIQNWGHFIIIPLIYKVKVVHGDMYALFRNKEFLVNLKTKRNASKFAIFMEKVNPCSFSFRATFIFPLWMPWSMKAALNEKWKKPHGFSFSINIANFEAFLLVFKLTKKLIFSEECSYCLLTTLSFS